MSPIETGKAYDAITERWEKGNFNFHNGIEQHKIALKFAVNKGLALDVGCGSTGRFIELLLESGFQPQGIDISAEMLRIAKQKYPQVVFHHQDICSHRLSDKFDFITAWDSMWHVPLSQQKEMLTK